MAPGQALTFSGITPQQFSTLSGKAQAAGIGLNGNSGSASKFGVQVSWDYDPASERLTLQCLSTPFFLKPEEVNRKIQALMNETLGETVA